MSEEPVGSPHDARWASALLAFVCFLILVASILAILGALFALEWVVTHV